MEEAVGSIGTIIVCVAATVTILGVILFQWVKQPRCSECGARVISRDIGLNSRATHCPSCGVGKLEPRS